MSEIANDETVLVDCWVDLEPFEKEKVGSSLVAALEAIDVLDRELDGLKSDYKARRKTEELKVNALREIYSTGREKRNMQCFERKDYRRGVVELVRCDNSKVVKYRRLEPEDKQSELFDDVKPNKLDVDSPKWRDGNPEQVLDDASEETQEPKRQTRADELLEFGASLVDRTDSELFELQTRLSKHQSDQDFWVMVVEERGAREGKTHLAETDAPADDFNEPCPNCKQDHILALCPLPIDDIEKDCVADGAEILIVEGTRRLDYTERDLVLRKGKSKKAKSRGAKQ